jgi:hypothetical protein
MPLTKEEKRRLSILKDFHRQMTKLIDKVEKKLGPKAIKEINSEFSKHNG